MFLAAELTGSFLGDTKSKPPRKEQKTAFRRQKDFSKIIVDAIITNDVDLLTDYLSRVKGEKISYYLKNEPLCLAIRLNQKVQVQLILDFLERESDRSLQPSGTFFTILVNIIDFFTHAVFSESSYSSRIYNKLLELVWGDINKITPYCAPIVQAVASHNIIRLLVANGFDINQQDEEGNTVLHAAVLHKDPGEILTDNCLSEVDGTIRNNEGNTALDIAAIKHDRGMVRKLVKIFYNITEKINSIDKNGDNALLKALYNLNCETAVTLLTETKISHLMLVGSGNMNALELADKICHGYFDESKYNNLKLPTCSKTLEIEDLLGDIYYPGNFA